MRFLHMEEIMFKDLGLSEAMLKALYKAAYEEAGITGQLSFEERMGCGFGACMGCSIETKNGPKRICKDGPVLRTEEILW